MAAVLKHWRESATLILVTSKVSQRLTVTLTRAKVNESTPSNSKPSQQAIDAQDATSIGDNFEVLMMKRSSKSKFMPNLHVFPGGVADNSDFSAQWLEVFKKLGSDMQKSLFSRVSERSLEASPMFTRQRDPEFSALPPDVAFRICAIREAFEESGVLLARPAGTSPKLVEHFLTDVNREDNAALNTACIHNDLQIIKTWRDRVNREPGQFLEMCLQLDLIPEIWCLHEWSNWLTPIEGTQNRRRFDTIFYVCCVDHKPEVEQDFGETVNALWASPSSLLSAYIRQHGGLGPPQIYELTRLLHFGTANDLLSFVSRRGRARVEQWFPVRGDCKDHILSLMPGDELYPKDPHLVTDNRPLYEETLEELNRNYPNQHRNCFNFKSKVFVPYYTIKPRPGHVGPRIDAIHKLYTQAKL